MALGRLSHPSVAPHLVRMLSDENEAVVCQALYGLGKQRIGSFTHVEEKLTDQRPTIRRAAAITVDQSSVTRVKRRGKILVPLLLRVMAKDKENRSPGGAATTAALSVFRKMGPSAAAKIAPYLADPDMQNHALDALNVTGAKDLSTHIAPLVKEPGITSIHRVIPLLEQEASKKAARMLGKLAKDDDPIIRTPAQAALDRLSKR